jgi:tetratricopeptide (TPR) repeat protein
LPKAVALLEKAEREFPENRYLQLMVAPEIRATQQVQQNQLAQAISTLESVRAYEYGTGPHAAGVIPIFLRGLTYLKMHDGAKAATEFQRILDHPGAAGWSAESPMARLNLARAYALQGDNAKARTAYQDFFAYWKDADPDVPVLVAAKAEYEKVK